MDNQDNTVGTSQRSLTFGEKAVGRNFNPGGDLNVDAIKLAAANFIDVCDSLRGVSESGEVKRMLSVAITEAQTAQMWAVKAATWKD